MEEIKYRYWDEENKTMIYGSTNPEDFDKLKSMKKDLIMKYVDTNFKNQEIYEGDIVETAIKRTGNKIKGKVIWDENQSRFTLELPPSKADRNIKPTIFADLVVWKTAKVLGNIYENPDILNDLDEN